MLPSRYDAIFSDSALTSVFSGESKKFIYRSRNVRLGEDLRGQLLIEPYMI